MEGAESAERWSHTMDGFVLARDAGKMLSGCLRCQQQCWRATPGTAPPATRSESRSSDLRPIDSRPGATATACCAANRQIVAISPASVSRGPAAPAIEGAGAGATS